MLRNGGGAIVNTSSIGGLIGIAGNSVYATSKWALAGLTKCAALDYARQGIRVNAIAPGGTRSEMFDNWITTEEARARLADSFPMNYIAHPDDMARYALFLLSDESRWTTGVVMPCEGGRSASGTGQGRRVSMGSTDKGRPSLITGQRGWHCRQGSEYPAVVIPVMTQHYTMLQRNLLYTGVTRGKRLVVLVGQKKAVAIAVRNVSGRRRWPKLKEWLEAAAMPRALHV
jgi:hypothetical protein